MNFWRRVNHTRVAPKISSLCKNEDNRMDFFLISTDACANTYGWVIGHSIIGIESGRKKFKGIPPS